MTDNSKLQLVWLSAPMVLEWKPALPALGGLLLLVCLLLWTLGYMHYVRAPYYVFEFCLRSVWRALRWALARLRWKLALEVPRCVSWVVFTAVEYDIISYETGVHVQPYVLQVALLICINLFYSYVKILYSDYVEQWDEQQLALFKGKVLTCQCQEDSELIAVLRCSNCVTVLGMGSWNHFWRQVLHDGPVMYRDMTKVRDWRKALFGVFGILYTVPIFRSTRDDYCIQIQEEAGYRYHAQM